VSSLHRALRLRIDSPYPGESMSSVIERAAQFYAMPAPTLLNQIMADETWSSRARRDLDLNPPRALERRLSECISDWRAPLADHVGFMKWTLAQRSRHAYCPLCFVKDLGEGRTPYFRYDWIPAMTTFCWEHQTPLFDWEAVDCAGRRRLPKGWIYRLDDREREFPEFMRWHLALLEQMKSDADDVAGAGDISLDAALQALWQLQCLTEKPSAAPMPDEAPFQTDLGMFRCMAGLIVQFASRHEDRHREPPIACSAKPEGMADWFGAIPDTVRRREWKFSDEGIRQTGGIPWRRSYLLFTARTLAGCDRFRGLFGSTVPAPPWRGWWMNSIRPRLGPEQQDTIDWHMRVTLREL
jgi:hypothetical protein